MSRRSWDLPIALLLALLAMLVGLVGAPEASAPWTVARIIAAVLLALILPGYTLTAALFVRPMLSPAEHGLLSLGLSLAVTILTGLLLDLTPWGLQAGTWALALGSLTWAAGLAAWWRRQEVAASPPPSVKLHLRVPQILCLLVAMVLLTAALTVAIDSVSQPQEPDLTQLWCERLSDGRLRISVRNLEHTATTYQLVVHTDTGRQQAATFDLNAGDTRYLDVALPSTQSAATDRTQVEVLLYRLDAPDVVYRRLHYVLPIQTAEP